MSDHTPALRSSAPATVDSDYDSILAAVMETARGRAFLHEYARRNRTADTGTLLAAIGRIESLLQAKAEGPARLPDMAAIGRVHREIAGILDSLIECGAPTFLCNDLARSLKALAALCAPAQEGAEAAAPAAMPEPPSPLPEAAAPPAIESAEAAIETAASEMAAASDTATAGETGDASTPQTASDSDPQPDPAPQPRDPFADIRALSSEEKIALFT